MESLREILSLSQNVPLSLQLTAALAVFFTVTFLIRTYLKQRAIPGFPLIALDERGLNGQQSWRLHSAETLEKGLRTCDGPFQILTNTGPRIILPNRYGDEVKAHPDLNFEQAVAMDLFSNYPGFQSFSFGIKYPRIIADLVRTKLTQSLGLVTENLVDETTDGIHDIYGEDSEWHAINVNDSSSRLVARLSSRVFVGKPLCRNQRWLEIARHHTIQVFSAAQQLRAKSPFLRPFVHWFMKPCIELRKQLRDAKKLVTPEVKARREQAQKTIASGEKVSKISDVIGWAVEMTKEPLTDDEYVCLQLALSVAAIHTTTEALTAAVFDLCKYPESVQPLREEIIKVIGEEGWSKTGLYKLRYLDSFLKESQRFTPAGVGALNRLLLKDLTLSNGTVLPKGCRILVPNKYMDPDQLPQPERLDGGRFVKMREEGNTNAWQHVTVTKEHLAFGYGAHACPGRFFASNELKIALAHLVLKYDFKKFEKEDLTVYHIDGGNIKETIGQDYAAQEKARDQSRSGEPSTVNRPSLQSRYYHEAIQRYMFVDKRLETIMTFMNTSQVITILTSMPYNHRFLYYLIVLFH